MEDYLKLFLIAGVVIVGIIKEFNKKKAPQKAETNQTPDPLEPKETQTPRGSLWEDIFGSTLPKIVLQSEAEKTWAKPLVIEKKEVHQKPSKKETLVKTKQPDQSELLATDVTSEKESYTIKSMEEVRRAIILGEILQRKY